MAIQKLYVYGTKHGDPFNLGTNFVDVCGLLNPVDPMMLPLCGLHTPVYKYVINSPNIALLITTATQAIQQAGMNGLTEYGIRCSGGRHRSPAFAWYMAHYLNIKNGLFVPNLEFAHDDPQRYYNLICKGYANNDLNIRWARGEG